MKPSERPTVLVVEDEFIIALDLSETVRDLGFRVEGPFADKENAFIAIDRHMPDCAILDVKTADGDVYPLADALADAGVPIIFHSGHIAPDDIADRYPEARTCSKPCPPSMANTAENNAEPTNSQHTIAVVLAVRNTASLVRFQLSVRALKASRKAPAAPTAADSVAVVMPNRITASTSTVRMARGITDEVSNLMTSSRSGPMAR